ncbi:CLUMA_CG016448, isoform A [Clunio marinus]|uniref:CLUMA_CG016448, isoform A n=1 Tax=Clunio marinus TaxID=568069 RepID=A0A1J1ISM2_9DIPT|nr:CLUMA_CG016448, isoform A [Clunio marinus]
MFLKTVTCLLFLTLTSCLAQDNVSPNAQPRVAPHLQECYRQRDIFERDNRLPMTPQLLIELIRRAEDFPGTNLNLQQFTSSLLHRFKQDGILPSNTGVSINQNDILPFNTNGFNFPKHRVLLTRLIPGNHAIFPTGSLTLQEQCALHFMLSTSIETQRRGDENERCNRLAQYRALRVPRSTDEVEMMKKSEMANVRKQLHKKFGRYQNEDEEQEEVAEEPAEEANEDEEADENEEETLEIGGQTDGLVDVASNLLSDCPVENGVVHSPWGSIAAGTVIAGIAAGLERQTVNIRDLVDESHLGQYRMARQQAIAIDNRYAATLSGDIAEAVLLQAPATIQVGASGGWNNTAVPNWFFVGQRERLQITDAEIRGGVDGLLIAHNIINWRDRASNLRLSQVLDMYYSQRGIFGMESQQNVFRACNRRDMLTNTIPSITATLAQQSFAFTTVLDNEMQSSVTLTPNSTQRISAQASDTLWNYIRDMPDAACITTELIPGDDTVWRVATDIYIFVDTTWMFRDIHSTVAHLLNNLDVNRFGSSYTIMNAMDGTIIVNSTNRLADLYTQWNQEIHTSHPMGFNIRRVLETMREHSTILLDHERATSQVGGRSHIALVMVQSATVNDAEANAAEQDLLLFRDQFPDLRFFYWASGNPDRFARFVRQPQRDTFRLNIDLQGIGGESIVTMTSPVILRIIEEPRRIINHRCGSNWQSEGQTGMSQMIEFVEPRGVAFYRLHPNYFFHNAADRRVRIQGAGFSTLTVCTSRTVERPRANATNVQGDQVRCQSVNSDTMEFGLWDACSGHSLIHHCPPLFISVEGIRVHDGQNLRCTEAQCRFPDSARFNVIVDNLGCFSGVGTIVASVMLVVASILVTLRA